MADDFYRDIYNPDVLSCLANLSNDEVFTPPEIANQMLDLLPQELFSDPNTTFLDPACKSGVFLREIAKRLLNGLEPLIPGLQPRIDHIFHHQLYGIAITEITSLLSRRSVYCSKYPNSIYAVTRFDDAQGNIRTEWKRHEETVSSNRREAPFAIDDGTGRLRVKPKGSKGVELVKAIERFQQGNDSGFGSGQITLSMGRFQMSVGSGRWDLSSSRTLGYRFVERVLPVGKPVYAIGEVAATEDEGLVLRPPTDDDKKKPFMLSPRTEEEIIKASEKSARILRIIAIVLGIGGVALAVFGVVRR